MNKFVLLFVIIVLIICGPLLFIWSLNELMVLGGSVFRIEYSLWSWVVSLVFMVCVRGGQ